MTHSLTRGGLAEGEREAELRERQGAGPLIVCILPAAEAVLFSSEFG